MITETFLRQGCTMGAVTVGNAAKMSSALQWVFWVSWNATYNTEYQCKRLCKFCEPLDSLRIYVYKALYHEIHRILGDKQRLFCGNKLLDVTQRKSTFSVRQGFNFKRIILLWLHNYCHHGFVRLSERWCVFCCHRNKRSLAWPCKTR